MAWWAWLLVALGYLVVFAFGLGFGGAAKANRRDWER
jgi:hypothetical protein